MSLTNTRQTGLSRFMSDDGETIVLRKFKGQFAIPAHVSADWLSQNSENIRSAAVVDVETTGLDSQNDRIIEIGARLFQFDRRTGELVATTTSYSGLQDPGMPLTDEIKTLTGLSDEMLAGQKIDWAKVDALISQADVVIAHNAAFDRPFIEKEAVSARTKIWACSFKQIDWKAKGFGVQKLDVLSLYHGFFTDAHRALNDVDALLHLLSMKDHEDSPTYLFELLQNARQPMVRVVATGSPFETKDLLKRRGYRWDGIGRAWYRLLRKDQVDAEIAWLESDIYAGPFRGQTQEVPLADQFKGPQ